MTEKPSIPWPPLPFEELVRRTRDDPSPENLEALWASILITKTWFFLPANVGETTPLVIDTDQGAVLPIFLTAKKATAYSRQQGVVQPDGSVPLLVLTPYDSMLKIVEVAPHLSSVVFNIGDEIPVRVPPKSLIQYAEHFGVFGFTPND